MTSIPELLQEDKIGELLAFFEIAQSGIVKKILGLDKFTLEERRGISFDIQLILKTLSGEIDTWTPEAVESHYKSGAELANKLLEEVGRAKTLKYGSLDGQALKIYTEELLSNFAESIQGLNRSTSRLLSDAEKQYIKAKLVEGKVSSETRKQISADISGKLKANFVGLTDKSGRVWDIEVYARMLTRTKLAEIANSGMMNELIKEGYDLVIVSNHNSKHRECRIWEGKVLSISGASKGYQTVDEAKAGGLFHPNCEHRVYPYIKAFAETSTKWSTAN